MRVYIPASSSLVRALRDNGVLGPPITAFAVTPALREYYVDDDIEELEYSAALDAARASLRLLSGDPDASRRRMVIAADIADDAVEIRDDLDRGVVRVHAAVPMAVCAAVHTDSADAESAVETAVSVIDAADLGEPSAEDAVDDVGGFELAWYATQEIDVLLAEIGR